MTATTLTVGGAVWPALHLCDGRDEAFVLPALGGRIGIWRRLDERGHRDWFQPLPEHGPADIALRGGGCYPLVPFSNRIENARFFWQEREIVLAESPLARPHALHGVGWLSHWEVERHDETSVDFILDFPGGSAWPWPFVGRQKVLLADGLSLTLSVENRSDTAQPVGLGFHPFFPRRRNCRLRFQAGRVWTARPDRIPLRIVPLPHERDFGVSRPVPDGIDDGFAEWRGTATIEWPDDGDRLDIIADPSLSHVILFSPPDRPFFCFEPVSHPTNAMNMEGRPGIRMLDPGDTWAVSARFSPA